MTTVTALALSPGRDGKGLVAIAALSDGRCFELAAREFWEPKGWKELPSIPLLGEPVKIDQRPNGCTTACIAMLTGIPLSELPTPPEDADDAWFESAENRNSISVPMQAMLVKHGWFLLHVWKRVPAGFAIAGGMGPRGRAHSIVVKDGVPWHDPHPSREGLVGEPEGYEILIRLVT